MPGEASCGDRAILVLGHGWGETADCVSKISQQLVQHLASFKGVRVYSTVLSDDLTKDAHHEASAAGVCLVAHEQATGLSLAERMVAFNEQPRQFFPRLEEQVPHVSHVVAHFPYTAQGAVMLCNQLYPTAQLVLLYHVLSEDLDGTALPAPSDDEALDLGEQADVVYSVTEKLYFHNAARFRNRARRPVDHRLYVPQCGPALFAVEQSLPDGGPRILTLALQDPDWDGLDIAATAVNKLALSTVEGAPPSLVVGCFEAGQLADLRQCVGQHLTCPGLQVEYHVYANEASLCDDLAQATMCLVPSRREPYGSAALMALSAGVLTLVSERSSVAPTLNRLVSEPELWLVPVTESAAAMRQDASVWRDHMVALLGQLGEGQRRARLLQTALRRDESARQSHDDITSFCLGGIHLKHEVTHVEFHVCADESREVGLVSALNQFLQATLRLCWRMKHNVLTRPEDAQQEWLPMARVTKCVINKIEEHDRKIVGYDPHHSSFIVYCPSPEALSDLWAMCDVINGRLVQELFEETEYGNHILSHFEVKAAHTRTIISGPEFLQYKQHLVTNGGPASDTF